MLCHSLFTAHLGLILAASGRPLAPALISSRSISAPSWCSHWGRLINRVVLLAKRQNIASIADFIAARYGKNEGIGALVAIIATIGIVPYISIQLKALSFSLETMMTASGWNGPVWQLSASGSDLAFFVTVALGRIRHVVRHPSY